MRSTLISLGWVESKFEAAFFLLWDAADNLVGLLLSHVDDTFSGGEGAYYEEQMQKLAVKIKLTFKKGTFRFCGKNVVQLEDLSIEVSQQESVENLEYMEIDKLRRKTPEAALIPEEITAFRSLIGAFGWIVRQTRHDLAVDVSMAAQSMGARAAARCVCATQSLSYFAAYVAAVDFMRRSLTSTRGAPRYTA